MSTSHHGRGTAVKAVPAVGGVLAFVAVCEAAHAVSVAFGGQRGTAAGVALVGAVFAACWLIHRVRPALRLARPARRCDPEPAALAEDRQPARLAA